MGRPARTGGLRSRGWARSSRSPSAPLGLTRRSRPGRPPRLGPLGRGTASACRTACGSRSARGARALPRPAPAPGCASAGRGRGRLGSRARAGTPAAASCPGRRGGGGGRRPTPGDPGLTHDRLERAGGWAVPRGRSFAPAGPRRCAQATHPPPPAGREPWCRGDMPGAWCDCHMHSSCVGYGRHLQAVIA